MTCWRIRHVSIFCFHSFCFTLTKLKIKYLEPHTFTLTPPRHTILSWLIVFLVCNKSAVSASLSSFLRFIVRLQAVTTLQSLLTCHDTCGIGAVCWWLFRSADRDRGNSTKAMTTEMHVSAVLQRGNNVQNSQAPRSDPSLWEDRC